MSDIPIATIPGNTTLSDILTNSTLIYMLIFLAIYMVVYFVLGMLYSSAESGPLKIVRIIDIIVILFVIIYLITTYANTNLTTFRGVFAGSLERFKSFAENPFSIFTVVIFLLALYTVIYFVKIPMTASAKPVTIMIVETGAILLFVGLLIFDFFKYLLKVDLVKLILDSWINDLKPPDEPSISTETNTPKSTCPVQPTPEPGEVFNIRNNLYTYDEAREVCSVYGAKLATYDQIEEAYNQGAEWCNYGWSEGQMALFPTQKTTWDALQNKNSPGTCPKKANTACGRPGINGGIIKNPKIRFGVNCYGKKPQPTDSDKALMKANLERKRPESKEDAELHAKLNVWKQHPEKFLLVNSFNKEKWSE